MSTELTVLAGIDYSESARGAAERAALLAAEHGWRLELLHVMNASLRASLTERFASASAAETLLIDDARKALHGLAAELSTRYGIPAVPVIRIGDVTAEIAAHSERASLTVLGHRGTNPLLDAMAGTTAVRQVRKSRRPVLIVKQAPQGPYRRVLVPVDFALYTTPSVRMAMHIAPGADITVFHAYSVPFERKLRFAGIAENQIDEFRSRARHQALVDINILVDGIGVGGRSINSEVAEGDPSSLVLSRAAGIKAALIVIGKHGRSAMEELLLGSVTRHVLAGARNDVLVVQDERSIGDERLAMPQTGRGRPLTGSPPSLRNGT